MDPMQPTTAPADPLLITVTEAARILCLPRSKVYELAAAGDLTKRYLPGAKRHFMLEYKQVKAYVQSLPTEPPAK